ncbi:MAG: selenocysteine-specific translation elongation factor [Calditrichia bacterium]
MTNQRQYIIGMAGHIDHGKTALVKALTGINTDRLKEEQERGITVDLGFAHLTNNVTIIDVPGHEKLIKNMVAGVATIDLVLFVVAADDGIMPQTREHLDIIKLMGIQNGIFAITKIDAVEPEWLELVEEELSTFLQNQGCGHMPIYRTSAVTGEGVENIRAAIEENLRQIPERRDDGIFRMPLDRAFVQPGFGPVVTGSVLSGNAAVGDTLQLLPDNFPVRIRGIQSHDRAVEEVTPGFRAALNLAGVEHSRLERGQVLVSPGYYQPVTQFNAKVTILADSPISLKNQMRVRLHIHTAETFARVILPETPQLKPGEATYAQFRLEKPIYAGYGDRFVLRQYSPQITFGGGIVLETNPENYRKKYYPIFKEFLQYLESDDMPQRLKGVFSPLKFTPRDEKAVHASLGTDLRTTATLLKKAERNQEVISILRNKEKLYFGSVQLEHASQFLVKHLEAYHRQFPRRNGMPLSELSSQTRKYFSEETLQAAIKWARQNQIIREKENQFALFDFEPEMDMAGSRQLQEAEEFIRNAGFAAPSPDEVLSHLKLKDKNGREILYLLKEGGKIAFVEEKMVIHRENLEKARQLVADFFRRQPEMGVPDFKDLLGVSRKFALPLLIYFDNQQVTRREGDKRVAGPKLEQKLV